MAESISMTVPGVVVAAGTVRHLFRAAAERVGLTVDVVDDVDTAVALATDAPFVGLVTCTRRETIASRLQRVADDAHAAFVGAWAEVGGFQIGPFAAPGLPGCVDCYFRRSRQHAQVMQHGDQALPYADTDEASHPHPLAPLVASAAARGFAVGVAALGRREIAPGTVYRVPLGSGVGVRGRVVAHHTCTRCRPTTPHAAVR